MGDNLRDREYFKDYNYYEKLNNSYNYNTEIDLKSDFYTKKTKRRFTFNEIVQIVKNKSNVGKTK